MTPNPKRALIPITTTLVVLLILLVGPAGAHGAAVPVKEVFSAYFGNEVDATTKGNVCTIESKDTCQPGTASSKAGGFEFPAGIAGAPDGDVYVSDKGNHRVQELTASGQFVSMFGREVDATTKGDVCTAQSGDVCKTGIEGGQPGQLDDPESIIVDPTNGNVLIAEFVFGQGAFGERVQEFTAGGQFVLEIGKEVNKTTKENLCTHEQQELGMECGPPTLLAFSTPYSWGNEHGAFNFESNRGNLLAAGGPEDLLYVGDENRVQELNASNGEWKGEIPLAPSGHRVRALALDPQTGDLYVVYGDTNLISVFDAKGEHVKTIEVNAPEAGANVRIRGLAIDSNGHLAVSGLQELGVSRSPFGLLYEASSGHLLTSFAIPLSAESATALGFNGNGELYAPTAGVGPEILAYTPVFVAELVSGVASCVPGVERETDVTLDCTLNGEVNPEGVSETMAWFEWGETPTLGTQTAKQSIAAAGSVQAHATLRPNSTLYYQLAGEDHNVKAPETLTSELVSVSTPLVAPKALGTPAASFITASAAVLSGELNPENASTEYLFEYAQGNGVLEGLCPGGVWKESCPGVTGTPAKSSAVYGKTGAVGQATSLQPSTTYSYRLSAQSENTAKTEKKTGLGSEATFTTALAPSPRAETGSASIVTATSAVISGTVDPDGLPATYSFELGVYDGVNTQYGTVFSGLAGASSTPVAESLALTGLQPGTTYAYRITVSSGYIKSASHTVLGTPVTFTTEGIPSVLLSPSSLELLAVPSTAFPVESEVTRRAVKCRRGYKRDRHGRCVKQHKRKRHSKH